MDIGYTDVMFPLLQTIFLRGPALVYFMDVVINVAKSPEEGMNMLEDSFLDDVAKRVSDDV